MWKGDIRDVATMSKHTDGIKCGDNGIHEFIIDDKELYMGGDGEEMMKRQVRCKDCGRRAEELYIMVDRTETEDMYAEILDK